MKRTPPILFATVLFFFVASLPATLTAETRYFRSQTEHNGTATLRDFQEIRDNCEYAAKLYFEHYEQTENDPYSSGNRVTTETVLQSGSISSAPNGSQYVSQHKQITFPITFELFNDFLASGLFYDPSQEQAAFDPLKARSPRLLVDVYYNDIEHKTYLYAGLQFETIGSHGYETISYSYQHNQGYPDNHSFIISALKEECPDPAPVAVYSISADSTYGSYAAARMIDGDSNTYFLGASGQNSNRISIILEKPAAISKLSLDWFSSYYTCSHVALSAEQFGTQQILAEGNGSGSASMTLTVGENVTPGETTQYFLDLNGCTSFAGVIREMRMEATSGW